MLAAIAAKAESGAERSVWIMRDLAPWLRDLTGAITRWAVVPIRHPLVRMSDPTITLMNYRVMGGFYRQLTRHIFGDPIVVVDAAHNRDTILRVAAMSRDGIVVENSTVDRRAVV